MKLVRYGPVAQERLGIVDEAGKIRDLASELGARGPSHLMDLMAWVRTLNLESLPSVESSVRLGPCVADVGKVICVGLNYRQHATEAGVPVPDEPVLFSKATSALAGPNDDLSIPQDACKVDWEVELAVVIGRRTKNIAEREAIDHIAGYCIMNDLSERAWQLEGTGQWLKGKSLDGFAPLGPWLVTTDEVPDPQELSLWLSVNGEMMQDSSTRDMVFPVTHLVSYISKYMTLLPGDVIATGTPQGVAMGLKPPRYLRAGDVVRLGIQGLGEQRQLVKPIG